MSYDLNVYLNREKMPTPENWRAAIVEQGFPVELDSEFDIDEFTGFLPCPVGGEVSGFEYYPSPLTEHEVRELGASSDVDFSILFSIGSRPAEFVAALSAASVLAAISDGTLNDPQSGVSVSGQEAVDWARSQLR